MSADESRERASHYQNFLPPKTSPINSRTSTSLPKDEGFQIERNASYGSKPDADELRDSLSYNNCYAVPGQPAGNVDEAFTLSRSYAYIMDNLQRISKKSKRMIVSKKGLIVSLSVTAIAIVLSCFIVAFVEIAQLESTLAEHIADYNQFIQGNLTTPAFGRSLSSPAASCNQILQFDSFSPSGYYWIRSSDDSAVRVYCDMTRSCGNITGGWMRVYELDMTDSSSQCPSGLRLLNNFGIRTCGINFNSASICVSVPIPVNSIRYSMVCGMVRAYQNGSTDGFAVGTDDVNRVEEDINIDTYYVDGVSLTYGRPRQHIWTFAADLDENGTRSDNCPCNFKNQNVIIPEFVRQDYFCDTGSEGTFMKVFYGEDPLWDGAGCGPNNNCCSFNNPPWFYRRLQGTTTDDIELRGCRDQEITDEDVPIEKVFIYIQ